MTPAIPHPSTSFPFCLCSLFLFFIFLTPLWLKSNAYFSMKLSQIVPGGMNHSLLCFLIALSWHFWNRTKHSLPWLTPSREHVPYGGLVVLGSSSGPGLEPYLLCAQEGFAERTRKPEVHTVGSDVCTVTCLCAFGTTPHPSPVCSGLQELILANHSFQLTLHITFPRGLSRYRGHIIQESGNLDAYSGSASKDSWVIHIISLSFRWFF